MDSIKYLFFALRPKQWIKNLFIFLPLIFGKKLFVFPANLRSLAAFCIFSCAAGAVYLMNDAIDYERDRRHPINRLRPVASGRVTIKQARVAAFILGILAMVSSFMLDAYFGWTTAVYLAFNIIYTKILKEAVIIDIFCIGGFFLLRIIAGCVIAKVAMSHWIIFMTVLLALFLGLNKRRQQLRLFQRKGFAHRNVLAKYSVYFIDQMVGITASSIAVAYMLYTVDSRTVREFQTEHLMYTIPFVYYGIFRYFYLIHKLHKDADPTRLLLADGRMQLNIALWLVVCIAVIYFKF